MTDGRRFRVVGRLRHAGAAGTPRIEGWEHDAAGEVLITSVDAEADGTYALEFGEGVERRPDVFLRATLGERTIATTEDDIRWDLRPGETRIDLEAAEQPVISGRVLDELHRPAARAIVRASRLLPDGEREEIAAVRTDEEGRYSIALDAAEPVDVELRVARHQPLTRFAVEASVVADLVLSDAEWKGPSAVERLARDVASLGAEPQLDAVGVERVAARTGADPDEVALFARARDLGETLDVPTELAFAFVAAGLPSDPAEVLATDSAALRSAVDRALDANQVPRAVLADADAALAGLRDRRVAALLDERSEDAAGTLRAALAAGGVRARRAQAGLAAAALDGGDRVTPPERLALDLAELTENNAALIRRVRRGGRVAELKDLAGLDAPAWEALIADAEAPVPASTPGATPAQRRAAYAERLAAAVEAAHPAAALLSRAANDAALPEREALARFVGEHPDFALDGPPVGSFLSDRGGDASAPGATVAAALQRLLPIAPRYADARTLLIDDLDSALAIAQLGKETFVARHAAALGGEASARALHNEAMLRSAASLHVLIAKLPTAQPAMIVMPEAPAIPDWQLLFGSADFCDCRHCGSVVGPAAYLTDVLHFLSQRQAKGGKTAKDVLLARRPDLAEIELTCENTNTTLPYVDLVNEILEAAIAPRRFVLDVGLGDHLDGGVMTSDLRDAFAAEGFPLPAGAELHVLTSGSRWCIRHAGWRHSIGTGANGLPVVSTPQTSGSSREQDANPEHVNAGAYTPLRTRAHPWVMPYDHWLEEVRAFLSSLGVRRAALMEDFGGGSRVAVAAERLGLGGGEGGVLGGATGQPRDAWGGSGSGWVTPLRTVRTLLDRSGLQFEELAELLALRWVNGDGALRIESTDAADPHTCDTTRLAIPALTADHLDRIHRFVRLRRRLAWTAPEFDRALCLLPGGTLDDDGLVVLADLEELRRDLDLDVTALFSLFAPLDTHRYRAPDGNERPSAYDEVFRSRAVHRAAPGEADRFALDASGHELAAVEPLAADPADPEAVRRAVEETRAAVAGAIGVTGAGLAILVDGPDRVAGASPVADLETLSALHRNAVLARALGLSVGDFVTLKQLVGLEPFVSAAAAIAPQDTVRVRYFVRALRSLEASGASIAELDHLLQHRVDPQAPLGASPEALAQHLTALREALRAIRDDTRAVPDPVGEVLGRKLVSAGWAEDRARAARELLHGTVVYRAPLAALPAGVTLPPSQPIRFSAGQLEFTGSMTKAQRKALRDLSTDGPYRAAVQQLFDAPRADAATLLAAFPTGEPLLAPADRAALFDKARPAQERFETVLERIDAYLRRTGGEQAVEQLLAGVLELSVASVAVLLRAWAYDPGDVDARLLARFVDPAFVDSTQPVSAATFPALLRSLALMSKVADLVRRWRLPAAQLDVLLAHAGALGWLDPAQLPVAESEPGASLLPWLRIETTMAWQAQLPSSEASVLDLLVAALEYDPDGADPGAEKQALLELWSRTAGWRIGDLEALLGARADPADTGLLGLGLPAADGDWNWWANEETWLRVRRCMEAAATTGASIAACHAWAQETVTQGDAGNARQAARARHPAETWPDVVGPVSDALRARRREALVAELVARPPAGAAVRDADDLFAWFLIDVEMAPCMTTSRLKQAISSVQLFAQRCLLNLEPDVPMGKDPTWAQWRWMKTYRVWEAARKIFLWPENWTEPELRDDKSPPFRELEEALAQADLDDESASDALQGYLEHLEQIAHLEVVGIHEEVQYVDGATRQVHVVARTRATPPSYFYRRRADARWTPWERVDADLEGDYVLPVIWNGRVHLLWPVVSEFQVQLPVTMPAAGNAMPQGPRRLHVQLAWTERRGAGWAPKRMTRHKLYPPDVSPYESHQLALAAMTEPTTGDLLVRVLRFPEANKMRSAIQHFRLSAATGTGSVMDQHGRSIDGKRSNLGWSTLTTHTVAPGVRLDGMTHEEVGSTGLTAIGTSLAPVPVLQSTPGPSPFRVRAHHFPRLGLTKPLVYTDAFRSFYFHPSREWIGSKLFDRLQPFAFHHRRVRDFARALRRGGLDALYERSLQTSAAPSLTGVYGPAAVVHAPFPVDDVDFEYDGAYAGYNWELFFHAPLLIADRLMVNQRFEEAQRWLHRIFDPTDRSSEPAPKRYWRTRPFFEVTEAEREAERRPGVLPDAVLTDQVRRWRADPFNPHAVARMRNTAYQRATVMKYLDNLIAWGDQLFRRDTLESLNEATQLYVLAAEILGRRPETVAPRARPVPQTFGSIAPKLDAFSNALVAAESLVPPLDPVDPDAPEGPPLTLPAMRYFCIPSNDKLLSYWDTIGDRLFKLRHCMNIEGVERQLPLFEPPIDPAVLVRAAAAGVDIGAAVADTAAPLPPYRFSALAQKASELCAQVKELGGALLAAFEKRDAEAMAALRADQELLVLQAVRGVRRQQVDEARRNLEALDVGRELTTLRRDYYAGQQFVNVGEGLHLAMSGAAHLLQAGAAGMEAVAGVLALVPNVKVGAPPAIGATYGGENLSASLRAYSGFVGAMSGLLHGGASLALTLGGYERRAEEWRHQARLADKELEQLDRQRTAAEIRLQVAERELANHDLQTANAAKAREVMEDKFTNRQLYDWMVGQVSALYFRSFQLAFDMAKRAERAYRYELGLQDSSFIRFGSWDSLRKGLLAGDRLAHELKRMEASWLDEHHRNFELTKTVSLALLDPTALLRLRETGSCFVTLPEGLFDLDHPGHVMRRIKSVSLTVPAVAGPYTNVNARLTLIASRMRTNPTSSGAYPWSGPDDVRFAEMTTAVQSIATSHGQRDAGVFQVDFNDQRYLPFEGQGAISEWRLELDPDTNRFDLRTVSDVLMHVSYTARDGGADLRQKAKAQLPKTQLELVDVRRELASEWPRFVHAPDDAAYDELVLDLGRLAPFRPRGARNKVSRVDLYARLTPKGTSQVPDLPLELRTGRSASAPDLLANTPLRPIPALGLSVASAVPASPRVPGEWLLRIAGGAVPPALRRTVEVGATERHHLDEDAVRDLSVVVHYVPA